jgi:hypothetical protein
MDVPLDANWYKLANIVLLRGGDVLPSFSMTNVSNSGMVEAPVSSNALVQYASFLEAIVLCVIFVFKFKIYKKNVIK